MDSKGRAAMLAVCLAATTLATAAENAKQTGNVRITIEIGKIDAGKKASTNSYEIISTLNGQPTEMSTGARIPLPVSTPNTTKSGDAQGVPMTAFTYQSVGVRANLSTRMEETGAIHLVGKIEVSDRVDERAPAANSAIPPTIGELTQALNVMLRDGSPLRVTTINEPGRGSWYLELKADVVN